MASASVYVGTPKHPMAQLTTANTNLDGSGLPVLLYTAGGSGARFESLTAKAIVSTTPGMIRIFVSTDGGTTKTLIGELLVTPAITKSATVAAFIGTYRFPNGLVLQAGEKVYVTTEKSEAFNCYLEGGGDF